MRNKAESRLYKKQTSVPCTAEDCKAEAGAPCLYTFGLSKGKPQRGVHGVRELAAFQVST